MELNTDVNDTNNWIFVEGATLLVGLPSYVVGRFNHKLVTLCGNNHSD